MPLTAHVTYSGDGYRLHVQRVPVRRLALAWLAEHVLAPLTYRPLCGAPEWLWKIGYGGRPSGGPRDHSIGSALYSAGCRISGWIFPEGPEAWSCPLADDVVATSFPESVIDFASDTEPA